MLFGSAGFRGGDTTWADVLCWAEQFKVYPHTAWKLSAFQKTERDSLLGINQRRSP